MPSVEAAVVHFQHCVTAWEEANELLKQSLRETYPTRDALMRLGAACSELLTDMDKNREPRK